jgi:hypothetical protein
MVPVQTALPIAMRLTAGAEWRARQEARVEPEPEITFEPLVGNRRIEDAAIHWIEQLERDAGRLPVDRRQERTFPGDIESPPRIIEVKAVGADARGADLPLEVAQVERGRADKDFYLYLVDRIAQGNPAQFRLKVFGGEQLARLLARARERRFYELPVPVAEFDAAPGPESL